MDTGGRIAEIQKKQDQNGGYDFYNTFQRAARAFCLNKLSDEPISILSAPVNEAERTHNINAFDAFKVRFGSSKSLEAIKKKHTFTPPGAFFEIAIDPIFSVEKAGVRYAYVPWLMQRPELSQRYAAVACLVMREAYKGTNLSNCQFSVADLVKSKLYSENQITGNTPKILLSDVRTISDMLKEF